jgi:hypothetical protein
MLENGIAIDSNPAVIREVRHEKIVTWASAPSSLFDATSAQFATIAEYRGIISGRQYHCMLADGSVLQFGYLFHDEDLIKHRLCFYPCPFIFSPLDIQDIQPGDDFVALFDIYLERELQKMQEALGTSFSGQVMDLRMRTPIRFDYDPAAQRENHAASHLHLLKEESRWPVFGPLSVGHFVRFVFKHFYPDLWAKYAFLGALAVDYHSRSIVAHEEQDLFIECQTRH